MAKNPLTILLYHGVTEESSHGIENFSGKHIPAREFRRQMRIVKDNCTPLSMDDVVELARSGAPVPRHAVAITFDDGYRNNHTTAAPILDDLSLPAIFYICAGMVDTDMMFTTDKVEDCINLCRKQQITIALDGDPQLIALATDDDKIAAVNRIKGYCKLVGPAERERVLTDLAAATEVTPAPDHAANYRMMDWAAVKDLDANKLFTVGGHSLYHHTLSMLPPRMLTLDIRTTLGLLEFNLGHPVTHFAYPEGQRVHYDERVIDTLQTEGVVCSPSAIDGINESAADLFNLRREMVGFNGNPFPLDARISGATA